MENILKTGTTTIGFIIEEGVILATDKRASMGYYIASKNVNKIAKIDEHIGMTIAGSVGDAQFLIRHLQNISRMYRVDNEKPIPVKSLVNYLSNVLFYYRYYSPFLIQLIVGGYDTEPRLFSVDMAGGVTEERYAATGSGTTFGISVLENEYRYDMSIDEAVALAEKAIRTAMQRDMGSGEGVNVALISKNREFRWIKV
ncbi:MAG: archaeal proteasome endopeptidase complex subunit beta [Candidatus Micrarchaeota archaeon]|nr:archaeal proteasome endopeptidase complex subunit beta [Candidatus Micrarchaeota archaeon]